MTWHPDAAPDFWADDPRIAAATAREVHGSMMVVCYALATCLAWGVALVAIALMLLHR